MTVNAITDTKKGRTGIAPTYLHTTLKSKYFVGLLTIYFTDNYIFRKLASTRNADANQLSVNRRVEHFHLLSLPHPKTNCNFLSLYLLVTGYYYSYCVTEKYDLGVETL